MLVKYWMSKPVITLDENDSMDKAIKLLKQHKISMLPIMKKGSLVGIVTDRDIKRASASDATCLEIHELLYLISTIKVKEIMTKDPITVPYNYTVEETAQVLLKHNISGVPVIDHEGDMVGTITQQANEDGRYTATSMYRAWKGFSFADKRHPSPWLTFLVLRIQKRIASGSQFPI